MDNLAIRNKFNQKTTRNGSTVSDQIYLLPYLTEKTNPNAGKWHWEECYTSANQTHKKQEHCITKDSVASLGI